MNSLTQTTLKLTVPGMPDFYQGTELWDFSLVDPDNRRPLDFDLRQRQLASLSEEVSFPALLDNWYDGRVKLALIRVLLRFRGQYPSLFAEGTYTPIPVTGTLADCVVAFERSISDISVLIVAPRFASRLGFPPLAERWLDTTIQPTVSRGWSDLLTQREFSPSSSLPLAQVLATFPIAVLVSRT